MSNSNQPRPFLIELEPDEMKLIEEFCARTGMTIQELFEEAIKPLMADYERKHPEERWRQ
jgi:hypothetical protein